jgi:NADH-quinone oxidoreductase subunit L
MIPELLAIATLLPLASAVATIFFGRRMGRAAGWFTTGVMVVSLLCCLIAMIQWVVGDHTAPQILSVNWIPVPGSAAGYLTLGVLADSLSVALMVMVTLISTLVHLYSIGYMEGDSRYTWFFAYLSLFTFSMLGIVTANGLMQLFVCWELVGLTSYLLIGFWFEKRGPQLACKKAFVMNRIGDAGFLIGFGILFQQLGARVLLPPAGGEGMFDAVQRLLAEQGHSINDPPLWLTIAGIGLFCGAIGKSAQFPLHTWLPDAMEGPTPVSSIVHSATMVAAGVYLTARIYPILTPAAHLVVATVGLITLVMAACMALVMTDIKRVLAYSTLSQLGYMILGLGTGAYAFALFHLITHAFFKCCLFQCAGSVIHGAHHQQDMRYYGGLKDKMPITATCYAVCMLAIAGASIPFTPIGISGFYSKDGIIAGAINYGEALGGWGHLFWIGPTVVAFITVFYMARSFALTFLGKPRDQHLYDHAHEAPWTMTVPQMALATMAVISAPFMWLGFIQGSEFDISWVQLADDVHHSHGMHAAHLYLLYGFAWIAMLALGVWMYKDGLGKADKLVTKVPGLRMMHTWAHNKFYFDALYDILLINASKTIANIAGGFDKYVIDGIVNLSAVLVKFGGWAVGLFDAKVVDGLVNGAAEFAQQGGRMIGTTHSGRVRGYVLVMFASATAVAIVVVVMTQF